MATCKECIHCDLCKYYTEALNEEGCGLMFDDLPDAKECGFFKPTADVVPKSEVERLKAELVRVQAIHPFAMTLFELKACEEHAAIKAVKEVWRELRSKCDAPHWCVWLSEIDDYFEEKTGVKTEDID